LTDGLLRPWSARLFYAYADALLEVGREDEAREWFARAAAADASEETDAAQRYESLDSVGIDDLADPSDGARADGGAADGPPADGAPADGDTGDGAPEEGARRDGDPADGDSQDAGTAGLSRATTVQNRAHSRGNEHSA